jgi:uncharacterized protein YchJ
METVDTLDPEFAFLIQQVIEHNRIHSNNKITILGDKIYYKLILSRNDPCYCGSGKKYKKCCINKEIKNVIVCI